MISLSDIKPGSLRGAEGFFRVGQAEDGQWWFIDPQGRPFFAAGVGGRDAPPAEASRLRNWGFNTVVTPAAPVGAAHGGVAWLPCVDFCEAGPLLRAGGARLPDVFDPAWPERAADHARRVCASHAESPHILGWRMDASIEWAWSEPRGRPTLLQLCLSLEPTWAAYHAAWEFALALHEGSLERMAEAWQAPLTNKGLLRTWTQEDRGLSAPGYLQDHRLWGEECARRYFSAVSAAMRGAAPNHLRFAPAVTRGVVPPWMEDVSSSGMDARVRSATQWAGPPVESRDPCWIEGFTWSDSRIYEPAPAGGEFPGLTRVERMLSRGRALYLALVTDPAVAGWSWPSWDDPARSPLLYGTSLVRADGSDADEHTEALKWLNARAASWRAGEK